MSEMVFSEPVQDPVKPVVEVKPTLEPVVDPVKVESDPKPTEPKEDVSEVSEEEKAEQEKQHKEGRLQKRFDKLTREKHELKGRVETLERLLQGNQPPKPQVVDNGAPVPEQFENNADFIKAAVQYEIEQREKAAKIQSVNQTWQQKQAEASKSIEDYDDVIAEAQDNGVSISVYASDAVMESPLGAEIQYYFAKNPDEADKNLKMSPLEAIRHIGRIEAKLEAAKAANPPLKTSSAPPPIKPPATKTANSPIDESKLSDDAWLKLQIKRAQGRK